MSKLDKNLVPLVPHVPSTRSTNSTRNYKYQLEPYRGLNTRYTCPNCGVTKKFTRYINTDTNEHLHVNVGRCNRADNCAYHYTPRQYFEDNNIKPDEQSKIYSQKAFKVEPHQPKQVSYISPDLLKASLKAYQRNHFVTFLISLFGEEVTSELISKYFIGSANHWRGSTVFWQIDVKGRIRTGKIMLYNPVTGKRVKEPYNHINWIHSVLKKPEKPDFNLLQCLYGEHLLIDNSKPVAIVESEKTAIIASVYLPEFIWLAVGSLTNLSPTKCSILSGRDVILFPDLNGFELWKEKALELRSICNVQVSDLLERKTSDQVKKKGFDLADFLILEQPPKEKPPQPTTKKNQTPEEYLIGLSLSGGNILNKSGYPITWDLFGDNATESTKQYIKALEKNPAILSLMKVFDLSPINK